MYDFWRNLRQGLENEAALVQRGMGNGEPRLVDHFVSKEKDVDIDKPRPFRLKALASQGAFDLQQTLQKRLRRGESASQAGQGQEGQARLLRVLML